MSALDTSPCGFACEATDFEHLALWQRWHEHVRWEQIREGRAYEIGTLDRRPICVCVFWAVIAGQRVVFYHGCSLLVDHAMVQRWVRANVLTPGGTHANAMNFHNVLLAIQRANEAVLRREAR